MKLASDAELFLFNRAKSEQPSQFTRMTKKDGIEPDAGVANDLLVLEYCKR
jgi:hypothetical protein